MFMRCYRSGQGEEGQVRSLLRSRSKSSSTTPAGAPAAAVAGSSAGGASSAAIESVPADPTMCRHPYSAAECEQLASEDDCACSDSYTVAVSRSQPVSTFVFPAVLHVSVQSPHVGSAAHAAEEFVTPPDHDPQQLRDWKQANDELDFRRWPSSSEVIGTLKNYLRTLRSAPTILRCRKRVLIYQLSSCTTSEMELLILKLGCCRFWKS